MIKGTWVFSGEERPKNEDEIYYRLPCDNFIRFKPSLISIYATNYYWLKPNVQQTPSITVVSQKEKSDMDIWDEFEELAIQMIHILSKKVLNEKEDFDDFRYRETIKFLKEILVMWGKRWYR